MNSCCSPEGFCCGTGRFFSRWSRFYARRFRHGGLEPVQKHLIKGISCIPINGATVLDIGCGVGSLHLTLLKRGAGQSFGVDMSEGMLREAQRFADKLNLRDRTFYVAGDFTLVASSIPDSDITVLDKVVCCYADVERLVQISAAKTRRTYALSHPKENLLMKVLFKGHMTLARLFHWSFHPFWHNWTRVRSSIEDAGFGLLYENSTILWRVLVFRRVEPLQ